MATQTESTGAVRTTPELRNGDRLDGPEFERRYLGMPDLKKAELIKGVVYMPSPVTIEGHGEPHGTLFGWVYLYAVHTPGVQYGIDSSIRLSPDNRPQPDVVLRIRPDHGGQSRTDDGYVRGAPELVAEIAASTVSLDTHRKREIYEEAGVCEYVVWRVEDGALDYWVRRDGRFAESRPVDGVYRSEIFPGLWLDEAALLRRDDPGVLRTLQQGLASPGHAGFVARLTQPSR